MKEYQKPLFIASTRGPRAAFPAALLPAVVAVLPVVTQLTGKDNRISVQLPVLTPVTN